jgi:hypothetical protein
VLNVRRLAAIDLVFLGPTFVVAEFTLGVFGSLALGLFVIVRSRGMSGLALGAYLISLGINYVPVLASAISMSRRGSAHTEIDADLATSTRDAMRRYRRGSLLLLLPLVVPVLAAVQRVDATRRISP